MKINAYRTLRICLSTALVLVFAATGFAAQSHMVRKGDTLYKLAKKYNTTVASIKKANRLNSSTIRVGQSLVILGEAATYGHVKSGKLELKENGKVIATLDSKVRFVVIEKSDGKYRVKLDNGKTGWVLADKVAIEENRQPLPVSDTYSFQRGIVQTAYAYRGTRYRRGGTGRNGFDCSGFTSFLYSTKGVKLPHSAAGQFKCGKAVDKSSLVPGDLVFFQNTYKRGISHVGIYVGNGKFVHASTSRGGVREDSLNADYYRRKYAGARRISS
ncbi:MAG: C40 family peptidase [Armatimonadota bacterium]